MAEPLALPEELTIYEAADFRQRLSVALQAADPVIELDLALVNEIDLSAVQIMLWATREAARLDKQLRLVNPSVAVRDYLSLTGLSDALLFEESAA